MGPEEMMKQLLRCQTASEKGTGKAGLSSLISPMSDKRAKALKQQLTDDEKDFIQYMTKALPPVISRAEVDRFLPGLVKPQTLAQADSAGLGPEVAWKIGRKVAYRTDSLLLWSVGAASAAWSI
jgi:hypothetical protein